MRPLSYFVRGRAPAAMLAALGAATLVLAACSGSSSNSSTGTTPGGSTGATATTAGGTSDPSSQIRALSSAAQNGQHATFKAVYKTSGTSAPDTVTIEQKPPKSFFSTNGGLVINNGTTTYFCSLSAGKTNCVSQGGANPLASIAAVFSPAAAIAAMQQAETQLAAGLAGYSVTFTTQSFAGTSATCINISAQGQLAKYCVTNDGILAYSGTAASSFELTSLTTTVSDSDFSLPAGASLVSVP